jgi:Flp pilus assembly protein TadG
MSSSTGGSASRACTVVRRTDSGNAIIEFVFVAVLVMVPLVYLIVTVAQVQRHRLAYTAAARDIGRAIATSGSGADGASRAAAALRLALANQNLAADGVDVRYVPADASCSGPSTYPSLDPGTEFAVCVTGRARLPAVPTVIGGRGVTVVGRFIVHLDDFRQLAP